MQIQDSCESEEEADIVSHSKAAMVCKLAQIAPEIWMTLSLDAKKWLLNERKRQQKDDDKVKRSLLLNNKESMKVSDRDGNNSGIPNQYTRVKVASKGEEEVQEDTDQKQNYNFIDKFLEKAVKTSSLYESDQEVEYDGWSTEHNIHASISINNTLLHKCMNLIFLPERYHISISDGGADTCVLGKGWEILSTHNLRREM